MKFSLSDIRQANMICFPEDFQRLYLKYSGEHFFGSMRLFDFIIEYGYDDDMLAIAEKMITDLLGDANDNS